MTVSTANVSSYLSTQDHCLKWLSHYYWHAWSTFEFESNWIESDQRAGRPYSLCLVVGICLPASSLQSAVSSSQVWMLSLFYFIQPQLIPQSFLSSDLTFPFPKCDFWIPDIKTFTVPPPGLCGCHIGLCSCPLNCVCAVTPATPAWYTIKYAFL